MGDGIRKRRKIDVTPTGLLNIFQWNIANFRSAFEKADEEGIMTSPVFVGKSVNGTNSFWKIAVYFDEFDDDAPGAHLEVYIKFNEQLNRHNPVVKVRHEYSLLDRNQKQLCSVGLNSNNCEVRNFGVDDLSSWGYTLVKHSQLFDKSKNYLDDDVLRVQVKIWIQNEVTEAVPPKQKKVQVLKDLGQLLFSPKFSDVTVVAEDVPLKAHKIILSCRSPVFSAMFQNEMSESITNTVKIEDFSIKTVKGMLEFIYSGDVEDIYENYIELLKISDKYQLEDLKTASTDAAISKMSSDNAIELLILGDVHNSPELKSKAAQFINCTKDITTLPLGNQNGAKFQKFAEEYPKLLVEVYENLRNASMNGQLTTVYTTNQ